MFIRIQGSLKKLMKIMNPHNPLITYNVPDTHLSARWDPSEPQELQGLVVTPTVGFQLHSSRLPISH